VHATSPEEGALLSVDPVPLLPGNDEVDPVKELPAETALVAAEAPEDPPGAVPLLEVLESPEPVMQPAARAAEMVTRRAGAQRMRERFMPTVISNARYAMQSPVRVAR